MSKIIVKKCRRLLKAYKSGALGNTTMPESSSPASFGSNERRLAYFTLPMSLNYQRDSYKLWQAALETFNDRSTRKVFDVKNVSNLETDELRKLLTRHKLALQPNKHIQTWQTISKTVFENWGSIELLIKSAKTDFLELKKKMTIAHKKGFPYLSGPKIFNYWSFIIQEYGGIKLSNSQYIEIAPDTHVVKASILLGIIDDKEAETLNREQISKRWREILNSSGIKPIEMHPPLWFWSRNGFKYQL